MNKTFVNMDYEKLYKNALEAMEDCIPNKDGYVTVRPCDIFPELAESEDERIRKELIKETKSSEVRLFETVTNEKFIAWLEKQGKKECTLKSSKDEDVRKFMQYIEKEAKAYEFNLPNRGYDIYAFAKDILAWLEKQCEQKPKWTEEDSLMIDSIIDTMKWLEGKGATNMKIDWLKSIKQRMGGEE